jgi:NTE family protein
LATRITPVQLKVRDAGKVQLETVLVMQGGGSLGAYECGVYKTLANRGIKFDIIAGTSIGAINAAIIVGSKNDEPARDLEDFWLDVAEKITPPVLPDNIRCLVSSTYAAMYGNLKAFVPLWFVMPHLNVNENQSLLSYYKWPYLYSTTPLKTTLLKYVDFSKLSPSAANSTRPRLIITSTDIQKGESVTFDSRSMSIDADHVIACAGFPFYGIAWTEKDGRFLWDGALQSNTPLREVIDASPKSHKNVYIVNLFPRIQNELPENMLDSWHRAQRHNAYRQDRTQHKDVKGNFKIHNIVERNA